MITSTNVEQYSQKNFNKFSKVNLSSSRDYLSYAYGNSKIQYYNDPKKEKKKSLKIATSLALIGISAAAIVLNTVSPKNHFRPNLKLFNGLNLAKDKIPVMDLKLKDRFTNLTCNFTNIKDDLWDRVSKKTVGTPLGFIDDIGDRLTKLYRKWVYNSSLAKEYNKAYSELLNKYPKAENIEGVQNFDTIFNTLNNEISAKLHEKGERISENLFFKKGFFNKIINETLADTKINQSVDVQNALKKIEIPQNIPKEAQEAFDKFNEVRLKTTSELVPKLRDINAGNAPTDLLTILASTGTLMGAVALEEDKDEKKSIVINLGIPLITTLATQIYGTVKLLSGPKALIFGLATGQIASQAANLINMAIENFKNKNNNKNTQA